MLLEHETLLIKLEYSGLIDQPRALSRELISALRPSGSWNEQDLHGLYDFTQKVALR